MNKKLFDSIIKQNLTEKYGDKSFGYKLSKEYELYYSKNEFESFLTDMQCNYPSAFEKYDSGKGSELKEQYVCGVARPPKMASVASSSRFCYLALRDGGDGFGCNGAVEFEKGCEIKGIRGNAPQLDAFFSESEIYIEAKCHEIFDKHTIVMSEKYRDLICDEENGFGLGVCICADGKNFEISPSSLGIDKDSTIFDIKQFLCHLMGIACEKAPDDTAKLVYLFFKPKTKDEKVQAEIDMLFENLKCEIETLFECDKIKNFISKNKIILEAVAEYSDVMETLNKDNIVYIYPSEADKL